MRKPVEFWHLILSIVLLLGSIVSIIVTQSNRITKDEAEISHLQENKATTDENFRELKLSLKEMDNQLVSIRILLEDKENRKN